MKLTAIVLGVVRHSDSTNIVTAYSRECGILSFASPISSGRGARLRAARLMPLGIVSTDCEIRPGRDLHRLGSFDMAKTFPALYANPMKSAVAIFVNEFLAKFLRDSPADAEMFDFIAASLEELDTAESQAEVAAFPVRFLFGLTRHAGILPNTEGYIPGMAFDMRAGRYTPGLPNHRDTLPPELGSIPARLVAGEPVNNREALKFLLAYYRLHLPGLDNFKSLEILHVLAN